MGTPAYQSLSGLNDGGPLMQTSTLTPALSPAVSQAIHQLRVPLILAVMMLHTLPLLRFEQSPLWLMLEQTLRVARPLFFFCAAYLLFRHWQSGWSAHRQLVQHRLVRLGLPLLVWGLLLFLAYQVLLKFGPVHWVNNPAGASAGSAAEFVALIVGIDRNPLAYQFWFIRDLLLLTVLAPLVFLLWRLLRLTLALVFVALFLCQQWPWFQPALVSTVFFVLGAVAALEGASLKLPDRLFQALLLSWIGLIGLFTFTAGTDVAPDMLWAWPLSIVAGALWVWNLMLRQAQQPVVAGTGVRSDTVFFVFAAHEPLLTLSGKIWHQLVPQPPLDILLIGLPFLLFYLLSTFYRVLVQPVPLLNLLLVGRR